jgi:hypothetical protein
MMSVVRSMPESAHTEAALGGVEHHVDLLLLGHLVEHRIQLSRELLLELLLQRLEVLLRVLGEALDVALLPLDLGLELRARVSFRTLPPESSFCCADCSALFFSFSSRTFWSFSALTRSLSALPRRFRRRCDRCGCRRTSARPGTWRAEAAGAAARSGRGRPRGAARRAPARRAGPGGACA